MTTYEHEALAALRRIEGHLEVIKCSLVHRSHERAATKSDLDCMERNLMSAISDFAAKQAAFNTRLDAAVSGVTDDVAALNKKIEELQNSPGTITPEDQALLNELEARGDAITAKLEALDALTPPTPPPA